MGYKRAGDLGVIGAMTAMDPGSGLLILQSVIQETEAPRGGENAPWQPAAAG